ncbi:MAG: SLBB domain-containing protein [Acidimicrobiia bacterium]|nr:SLBB domain-containing protein [Acidimicrobiia bacterium]
MTLVHRVLPAEPVADLDAYRALGGLAALEATRAAGGEAVVEEIEASGLRGRGGAGFPTGVKWRSVATNRSDVEPTTVVVNGAEGEPGTFKDRAILAANPYQVIEGALIAALVVGADRVVFGVKPSSGESLARLRAAIGELGKAGLDGGIDIEVFEGPGEYLYGEETALLESIEGRPPFPRIAPPYRRGVEDLGGGPRSSGLSATVDMAGPLAEETAAPALVDNVETLANVPWIVARGADWFRELGTDDSPGTIVCTVTGSTRAAGVGEVPMGTTLREVIEDLGGGARRERQVVAVAPGVSSALLPAAKLDTPLTYEAMLAAGSGLGSCGFTVYDDRDDLVAAIAGASRFLAVESCGQCTPCKGDGRAIAGLLAELSRSELTDDRLGTLQGLLDTVSEEARCYLAVQHEAVVRGLLDGFPDAVVAHFDGRAEPVEPRLVAELVEIRDGRASVDERHRDKQPDWTYGAEDSGQSPADRLDEKRAR